MKRSWMIGYVLLLMAAGLLGWLLPAGLFRIDDELEAGKTESPQIRQFDLNYQSDLDAPARVALVGGGYQALSTPLDRGIYLRQEEIAEISQAFLRDLTGTAFPDTAYADAVPTLLSFPGEGTILVWVFTVLLNDSWDWEALIDDQTGLILHCSFSCHDRYAWESLFQDPKDGEDPLDTLLSRISEAIRRHYSTRLSAALTSDLDAEGATEYDAYGILTLLKAGEVYCSFPLELSIDAGLITIN